MLTLWVLGFVDLGQRLRKKNDIFGLVFSGLVKFRIFESLFDRHNSLTRVCYGARTGRSWRTGTYSRSRRTRILLDLLRAIFKLFRILTRVADLDRAPVDARLARHRHVRMHHVDHVRRRTELGTGARSLEKMRDIFGTWEQFLQSPDQFMRHLLVFLLELIPQGSKIVQNLRIITFEDLVFVQLLIKRRLFRLSNNTLEQFTSRSSRLCWRRSWASMLSDRWATENSGENSSSSDGSDWPLDNWNMCGAGFLCERCILMRNKLAEVDRCCCWWQTSLCCSACCRLRHWVSPANRAIYLQMKNLDSIHFIDYLAYFLGKSSTSAEFLRMF